MSACSKFKEFAWEYFDVRVKSKILLKTKLNLYNYFVVVLVAVDDEYWHFNGLELGVT